MKIKQKDINLYTEFIKTCPDNINKNHNFNLALIGVFSVVLIVFVTVSVKIKAINIEHDINNMNVQIQNLCDSDEFKSISEFNEKLEMIEAAEFNIEALNKYIEYAYTDIPSEFLENIRYSGNSVNISYYSYKSSEHSLSLEGKADSPSDISAFIKKLRKYDICENIEYSGYTSSGNQYKFTAVCIFKSSEQVDLKSEEAENNE